MIRHMQARIVVGVQEQEAAEQGRGQMHHIDAASSVPMVSMDSHGTCNTQAQQGGKESKAKQSRNDTAN